MLRSLITTNNKLHFPLDAKSLCLFSPFHVVVRHAGGGGRPGGKPTFSWKQRKILGLDRKNIPINEKIRKEVGNLASEDELKKFVADNKGILIKIEPTDSFTIPKEIMDADQDLQHTRKKLNVTSLFGPDKARGYLPPNKRKDRWQLRHNLWLLKTRYNQTV